MEDDSKQDNGVPPPPPSVLERYTATMPMTVVRNVVKRAANGQSFGRRRLGTCIMGMIDISGFTSMTEKYIHNKDKIQQIINSVLVPLMHIIKDFGFELIDIAGDALLFYRPLGDNTVAAQVSGCKCLVAYVAKTRAFVTNSSLFKRENMEMKYAATIGALFLDLYEGAHHHGWIIESPAWKSLEKALKLAQRGDAIFDEQITTLLKKINIKLDQRNQSFHVLAPNSRVSLSPLDKLPEEPLPELEEKEKEAATAILEKFVPDLVRACGDGTRLPNLEDAIIAPAVIVFISIKSLDTNPIPYNSSQKFFSEVTVQLSKRKGLQRQYIRDDKGTVFIGIFREQKDAANPAHNAILWGLDVEKVGKECGVKTSAGIAMGTVYLGPLGSPELRVDFTLMGFEVNLSARYMAWALKCQRPKTRPYGLKDRDIDQLTVVTKEVAAEASACGIEALSVGSQKIKGSEETYEAFALIERGDNDSILQEGESTAIVTSIFDKIQTIVGRDDILEKAGQHVNNTGVCLVEGASALGKTMISLTVARKFIGEDVFENKSPYTAAIAGANAARKNEPFLPIKTLLKSIKKQDKELQDGPDIINHLKNMAGTSIDSDIASLVTLMPWIKHPEPPSKTTEEEGANELLAMMAAKVIRSIASQQHKKTVIIFDDVQWYDEWSHNVVERLIVMQHEEKVKNLAVLVTSTSTMTPTWHQLTEKVKAPGCVVLHPLESAKDSLCIVLLQLGVKEANWDSFLERHEEFGDLIHQATDGVPGMIRSCAQSMLNEGTIKASAKTFRLMCPLDEVPIFKSFHSKNVSKFLSLDKDYQLVLKYAALIGTDFDNDLLKETLVHTGIDEERISTLLKELVEMGMFTRDPKTSVLCFASEATSNAITSTMLDQQKMRFCTRLSNLLGPVYPNNNVPETLKRFAMARKFAEAMMKLGHNRLGETLVSYARYAKAHGYSDLAIELFMVFTENINDLANVVHKKSKKKQSPMPQPAHIKGSRIAPSRDDPNATKENELLEQIAKLDQRKQLSVAEVHEIYTNMAIAGQTMDTNIVKNAIHKACELIGFPCSDDTVSSKKVLMSKWRLQMSKWGVPLFNIGLYPTLDVTADDHNRIIQNQLALCNAAAFISGTHLGIDSAVTWWINEGMNIVNTFPTHSATNSPGFYASTVARGIERKVALKAWESFTKTDQHLGMISANTANADPDMSSMHLVSVHMMEPVSSNHANPSKIYDQWAKAFLDENVRYDEILHLSGPMAVYSATGMNPISKRLGTDCEAAVESTLQKFSSLPKALERVCTIEALWVCSHMACPKDAYSLEAYRSKIMDHYDRYLRWATRVDWSQRVLPGTKVASIALHFARICFGPALGKDAHTIATIVASLATQMKIVKLASKQTSVYAFMAFDTASMLLKYLDEKSRVQFRQQMNDLQKWATEILEDKVQKELFPEFHNVALQYIKAYRLATKGDPTAGDAMVKAANMAKRENIMLIYANAVIQSHNKQLVTELEKSTETGLPMYVQSRFKTTRDFRSTKAFKHSSSSRG